MRRRSSAVRLDFAICDTNLRECILSPSTSRPLRRNTAFLCLWWSETISFFGSAVTVVALPLLAVKVLQATPLQVGLLVAMENVAWLVLGLPAGVWVDRWDKRRVVVVSDCARAFLLATVPVAALAGLLSLGQLYVVSLSIGVFTIFFSIAHQTFLPTIVEKEDLVAANGRTSASKSAADILGPGIGGALAQFLTPAGALLADAVSFAGSALLLARVPKPAASVPAKRSSMRIEIIEGLNYVLRDPRLRALTFCSAQFNLFFGVQQALVMVFLVRVMNLNSWQIGLLFSAAGAGGMLAALLSSRLVTRLGPGRAALVAMIVGTLLGLLIPAARGAFGAALFALGYAGLTFAVVVFSVISGTFRQATCPQELLGRMVATTRIFSWGVIPLGGLAGGIVGELVGVRGTLWLSAFGFALCPLWLALTSAHDLSD